MLRKCYGCDKELTLHEAMKGQAVFDWLEKQNAEFAGWVHCRGEDSQFVIEADIELEELCKQMDVDLYEGTPHACNKCARELASMEGIEVPKSVVSGEDFIYRCPECENTHIYAFSTGMICSTYKDGKRVEQSVEDIYETVDIQCVECKHRATLDDGFESFHDYETEIV